MIQTRRRKLLIGAGMLLAASLSSIARPQSGRQVRIALLGVPTPVEYAAQLAAFRAGLRDLGYVEGGNLVIEYRWAQCTACP